MLRCTCTLFYLLFYVHRPRKKIFYFFIELYTLIISIFVSLLQVWVSVNPIYCSERSAEYHRQLWLSGGPPQLQDLLWHGPPGCRGTGSNITLDLLQPPELGGLAAVRPLTGWAHIHIPGECEGVCV